MMAISVTEARRQLSKLVTSGKIVEIRHPQTSVMIVPKDQYQKMENEILLKEIQEALEKSEKTYTSKEVDAMLAQVRKQRQGNG